MTENLLHPTVLFALSDPTTAAFFDGCDYVWEAIPQIKRHVARLTAAGRRIDGTVMDGAWLGDAPIVIEAGAVVEPGAYVVGPAYIGAGAVVRHGAYVRENVIMLAGSTLGHASEAKNALFLPGAAAPHFAYVGDSILGHHVNLGAGTKLSNLGILSARDAATGKRPTIRLVIEGVEYDTGLTKFGAILGDEAQTGCNAVLNPGSIIGPRTLVYANTSLRKGYHPADSIIKLRQNVRAMGRE
ncbi:MAG TPA: glucose-1-phosphate thymidylyltransferase [Promineifilum sp.]|nr:glucose-1-phosphate thymidylyltransferase [Promineifilum sp.]HRO25154.1 glucose-1-phosphate thymidylyltransferase [Promineifilum sp.]HRQ12796.1 glucose-1-phosphate thymidylyltransferase [Promineifilum sp.]